MVDVDEERMLPRATVAKFIKAHIPSGMRCSAESRELVVRAATEFVQLLSSEATEICNEQKKSKITGQHLFEACEKLGFQQYVESMRQIGQESNDGKKARGKARWKSNKTPEEMLASQQALLAKARNRTAQADISTSSAAAAANHSDA